MRLPLFVEGTGLDFRRALCPDGLGPILCACVAVRKGSEKTDAVVDHELADGSVADDDEVVGVQRDIFLPARPS